MYMLQIKSSYLKHVSPNGGLLKRKQFFKYMKDLGYTSNTRDCIIQSLNRTATENFFFEAFIYSDKGKKLSNPTNISTRNNVHMEPEV